MRGKYTCTFSNDIAKVLFKKSQQSNIAREGCANLSSPKTTITFCHAAQTLKNCFKN